MVAFLRHSGILFKKIINDGTLARRNDSLVLSIEIVLFPSPGKGHLILLWTRDIGEICWWFSGKKFALQWGERDNWKKKTIPLSGNTINILSFTLLSLLALKTRCLDCSTDTAKVGAKPRDAPRLTQGLPVWVSPVLSEVKPHTQTWQWQHKCQEYFSLSNFW